ncbi:MAG: tetratricopeptide repeat protein [Thermoanaerobaculia bacterium]
MDQERWRRLQELLQGAWSLAPGERMAFLDERSDDPELRQEVTALLKVEAAAAGYFQRLAGGIGVPRDEASEPAELTGRRVGSYRLVAPLGRGGMGVVYLAERADSAFEQQVAVKLLAMGVAGPEGHRRFVAERQILAGLEHPAIARLLDGGVLEDGTPYFVMERVEGERIDSWCDARRLGIRERLELLCRVCEAVDYAHRKLVVHRDLKPGNVFVTEAGDPKLLDFGVAKLLSDAGPEMTLTREAAPLTPEWAAPEQIDGRAVTTATDIYSLGAIAYRLLSGVRPHDRERHTPPGGSRRPRAEPAAPSRRFASLAVLDQVEIAGARVTSPRELQRVLAGDLDAILLCALANDPERRHGSAAAFAADLKAYLEARPVSARAPSLGYSLGRFLVRRRTGVAAVAAIAALLVSLVVVSVRSALISRRQALQVAAERDRAEEVTAFLKGLFESTDPDVARGRVATTRDLLDQGTHQVRVAFRGAPELRAEMLVLLGNLYRQLGEYEQARPLLEEGLALAESGEELGTHVDVLQGLGALDREVGRYDPSLASLERAERLLTAAGMVPSERHGDLTAQLVFTLGHMGRRPEAVERAEAALTLARADADLPAAGLFDYLYALGLAQLNVGQLESAEALFREAIGLEFTGADAPSRSWSIHRTMGLVLWRKGDFMGSLDHFRRALTLAEQNYPPLHFRRAVALNYLAWPLTSLGRLAEAEDALRQAQGIYETIYPEELHARAYDLHIVRGFNLRTVEKYAAAELHFARARDVAAALFGRDDPRYLIAISNLGDVFTDLGRYREAEDLLREALDRHIGQLGRDHYRVGETLTLLAGLHLAEGRTATALERADEALAVYRRTGWTNPSSLLQALGLRARVLDHLGRIEEARAAFAEAIAVGEAAGPNAGVEWPRLLAAYARFSLARGLPQAPAIVARALDAHRQILGAAHPATRRIEALASEEPPPLAATSDRREEGIQTPLAGSAL